MGRMIIDAGLLPVQLVDYMWVIFVYSSFAFWLAVLIDGQILRKFDPVKAEKSSTIWLLTLVFLQIALQGFISIVAHSMLDFLPSPVNGISGYSSFSHAGGLFRNPTVITVVLFFLSSSLQARLRFVFERYNKNKQ